MSKVETQHIHEFSRRMLEEHIGRALELSSDKRYEAILEKNGQVTVLRGQLEQFDWKAYEHMVAVTFVIETADAEDYARVLFSPKLAAFVIHHGR